jgi:hypothetical protein
MNLIKTKEDKEMKVVMRLAIERWPGLFGQLKAVFK